MPAQTAELLRENPVYSEEQKEEAYKLYASGMKLIDVGPKLGIKASTIGKWSSRYKWRNRKIAELREAGFVPKVSPEAGRPNKSTEIPENMTLSEAQTFYEERMRREALEFVAELANMPQALKLAAADKIEKRDKIARKALKLETEKPPVAINIRMLAAGNIRRLEIDSAEPTQEPPSLLVDAGSNPATDTQDATSEAQG